jgi:GNAT superfamily N-acetyltransferase
MAELIKTKELTQLTPTQAQKFKQVLKEASKDKFLSPEEEEVVPNKPRCVVILLGQKEEPVGFYCPKSQTYLGKRYWRAGTLFTMRRHQGKGIMSQVLTEYFDQHPRAMSWIEDDNAKSISLFTKLGFVKDKPKEYDGHAGHWYVREQLKVSAESLPIYLRW